MGKYYDGTKLLTLTDINGGTPEIYICTSNRTAGKTTYWSRYLVNRFIKHGEKFALIYRRVGELDGDIANKFFKDIQELFFPNYIMTSKKTKEGYCVLRLNDIVCGYAISLSNPDKIKKCSHLFSDVVRMYFDEFQSEAGDYLKDEPRRLQSVHTSIARGQSKMVRYVPVIMVSNPVSIINPYYVEWHISERLRSNTKFLRGDGWVLEQGYNENASKAQQESAFNRAYGDSAYTQYASQGTYLNDNLSFVTKLEGESFYIATIKYRGVCYALREYEDSGLIYCDTNPDMSYPYKISITTDDHDINYVMLKKNDTFIENMKYFFDHGCFRFKNLSCKEAVFKMLSY